MSFIGEKIKLKLILNVEIKVLGFSVGPSKQKPDTKLLTIQIEKGGDKRVVFTGSTYLMDQIERVPKDKFPFSTTIKGENDYFIFT